MQNLLPGFALRAAPWQTSFALAANEDWRRRESNEYMIILKCPCCNQLLEVAISLAAPEQRAHRQSMSSTGSETNEELK